MSLSLSPDSSGPHRLRARCRIPCGPGVCHRRQAQFAMRLELQLRLGCRLCTPRPWTASRAHAAVTSVPVEQLTILPFCRWSFGVEGFPGTLRGGGRQGGLTAAQSGHPARSGAAHAACWRRGAISRPCGPRNLRAHLFYKAPLGGTPRVFEGGLPPPPKRWPVSTFTRIPSGRAGVAADRGPGLRRDYRFSSKAAAPAFCNRASFRSLGLASPERL